MNARDRQTDRPKPLRATRARQSDRPRPRRATRAHRKAPRHRDSERPSERQADRKTAEDGGGEQGSGALVYLWNVWNVWNLWNLWNLRNLRNFRNLEPLRTRNLTQQVKFRGSQVTYSGPRPLAGPEAR